MPFKLLSVALCLALVAPASAGGVPEMPVEQIVERMEHAHDQNRRSYRAHAVVRDYQLTRKDEGKGSHVVARVEFYPPQEKHFTIEQSTGGFGESLVRRLLRAEVELVRRRHESEFTRQNYDFKLARAEHGVYVLELHPRRKDKRLIEGHAWVDGQTFLIRRVEGKLSKSPSFWIRDVNVVLRFERIGGMWLQTGTESVANVRFRGQYTLRQQDVRYSAPGPESSRVRAIGGR